MAEIIKLDGSRPLDFDRETVEQAYDRWRGVRPRVRRRVQQGPQGRDPGHNKIGGRVLEVGVGTGISLPQ